MPTEADTCRKLVVPKLQAAGWDSDPFSIAEQRTITDGRIVPVGKASFAVHPNCVDYLLRYRRDFPLAVVEAKAEYRTAADALQQAKVRGRCQGSNSHAPQTAQRSLNLTTSPDSKNRSPPIRNRKTFGNDFV